MPAPDPHTQPALHALYVAARNRARARVEFNRARQFAELMKAVADGHRRHRQQQRAGQAGAVAPAGGEGASVEG